MTDPTTAPPPGKLWLRVEVTADDIAHGQRNDCEQCPVARAMARVLPKRVNGRRVTCRIKNNYVLIHTDTVRFCHEARKIGEGRTSRKVREFVGLFDIGNPVEPFTFRLAIPERWLSPA